MVAGLIPFLAGCTDGPLSALAPAGEAASEIAWITWVMMIGTLVLMAIMSALGLYAVYGRTRGRGGPSSRAIIGWGGVMIPALVLVLLLVYGVRTGDSMLPVGEEPMEIRVTGHQWWWQFEYPGADGETFYTANELHLPVGRPVDIRVESADVIHSFWVPVLGGKVDAIPGRSNQIRLRPDRVGPYRGQCAEFCGTQHAHMGFHVEVHEEPDFEDFVEHMTGLDRTEAGPESGRQAFETHCATCHSRTTYVDGTGPNLASLAERPYLGAGTLQHTEQALRLWIGRHQQIKPGNHMPDHGDLDEETVEALARYLEAR